jgi:hypothetical protein
MEEETNELTHESFMHVQLAPDGARWECDCLARFHLPRGIEWFRDGSALVDLTPGQQSIEFGAESHRLAIGGSHSEGAAKKGGYQSYLLVGHYAPCDEKKAI